MAEFDSQMHSTTARRSGTDARRDSRMSRYFLARGDLAALTHSPAGSEARLAEQRIEVSPINADSIRSSS